mgnify:CR=1 FL=1
MAVRVLVVDDSSFFRKVVSEILNRDSHIEVIGTAVDGADAVAKVEKLKPDVITMDIEMPVLDGISAVRKIMALADRASALAPADPRVTAVIDAVSCNGRKPFGAIAYITSVATMVANVSASVARCERSPKATTRLRCSSSASSRR